MINNIKKISELRSLMQKLGLNAYMVPSGDEFMNEYVPPYARRLEWLTGFTGSAGMAIVLEDKAAFFTDGRYTLQASSQLPQGQYEIINTADTKPIDWLKNNLRETGVLGLNPNLYSKDSILKYQSIAKVNLSDDLIDSIWKNKPQKPVSKVGVHPLEYTGKSHQDKINGIINALKDHGADVLLLTAPDSICWLLNIRARDVPNTPLVLARLILESDGSGAFFVDLDDDKASNGQLSEHLGNKIKIHPLNKLPDFLKGISGKKILLDNNSTPCLFFNLLEEKNTIIEASDPCTLPKACKNKVEVVGAFDAHVRDGVAVSLFLCWLEENYKKQEVTEISAAEKLLGFRQQDKIFIEPSFDTIAGFASNGAIVHYKASPESNKKISGNSLLLLDSGGQYLSGTTDITRTIAIGEPTSEQKRNFTLVLKGHIAIATAIFPVGTTGHQIDILARQYLWQHGLDYDHGTGHGVGSFLGVHEGPQRISKAYNNVALMPGMIVSNEPGYYKNGEYGIRIENLVVVEEAGIFSGKKFLQFNTLTCVPIDKNLIDFSILDAKEKLWLKNYHESVYNKVDKFINKEVDLWLDKCCKYIT